MTGWHEDFGDEPSPEERFQGEYYADFDEESGLWCVFHTDLNSGHAYSSWASQIQAEEDAAKRNGNQ